MTVTVAAVAVALAIVVLRGLLAGRPQPSTAGLAAIAVVLLVTFQGLATLDRGVREIDEKYDRFAPLSAGEARDGAGLKVGIDPPFNAWAASWLKRGETFAVLTPFPVGTEGWLAYRLAPNTVARDRRSADWLIFFRTPDPYAAHRLSPQDYARVSWGPDAGMLRRIGAR